MTVLHARLIHTVANTDFFVSYVPYAELSLGRQQHLSAGNQIGAKTTNAPSKCSCSQGRTTNLTQDICTTNFTQYIWMLNLGENAAIATSDGSMDANSRLRRGR